MSIKKGGEGSADSREEFYAVSISLLNEGGGCEWSRKGLMAKAVCNMRKQAVVLKDDFDKGFARECKSALAKLDKEGIA